MYFSEHRILLSTGIHNYRIPTAVVTKNGTVLAFANDRLNSLEDHAQETTVVCWRRAAGTNQVSYQIIAAESGCSCMIGTAVYDVVTGTAICLFQKIFRPIDEFAKCTPEARKAAQEAAMREANGRGIDPGHYAAFSRDDGETWDIRKIDVSPNPLGAVAFTHGAGAGITIQNGPYKGRLLCPARYATNSYQDTEGLRKYSYNAAIYSDDHGLHWTTSLPVQQGTGEGALVELDGGTIYYNSRAYFNDNRRYVAYSWDGGETYDSFTSTDQLLEPKFGCNASMVRLDTFGKPLLLFSNPRHLSRRRDMTICISRDGARTWKPQRKITDRPAAYSCLAYDRTSERIFLFYETGERGAYEGITFAEFDLEWLMTPDL